MLALQGAFRAHRLVIEGLGAPVREVRTAAALDDVDALIIPGGESTTMSQLLDSSGLRAPLAARLADGMAVLGTCAGAILLASDIRDGREDQASFQSIDVTVRRNAYGRQLASFEADLEVADGAELPAGQVGELVIKGPQVMAGYWEASSEDILRDGWLTTGDLALMDSDGFFRIVGRAADAIHMPEGTVYPRDVEEVLYENNKVREAVVIGALDASGAPQIIAYVVPRSRTVLTSEELVSFCQRRLEPHAVPTRIEFRQELPRSATGKVARQLLEAAPSEP